MLEGRIAPVTTCCGKPERESWTCAGFTRPCWPDSTKMVQTRDDFSVKWRAASDAYSNRIPPVRSCATVAAAVHRRTYGSSGTRNRRSRPDVRQRAEHRGLRPSHAQSADDGCAHSGAGILARLLGSVMPFWMATSALLNLLLLLPFAHLGVLAGHLAQATFAIQVFAILFSLAGPVSPSTTGSSCGHRPICPPTGARRSAAGTAITGSVPWELMVAFALLVLSALH